MLRVWTSCLLFNGEWQQGFKENPFSRCSGGVITSLIISYFYQILADIAQPYLKLYLFHHYEHSISALALSSLLAKLMCEALNALYMPFYEDRGDRDDRKVRNRKKTGEFRGEWDWG